MNKEQPQRTKQPRVRMLAELQSRVHFCRSAALVRLTDGMGRIVSVKQQSDAHYELSFDGQTLVRASLPRCPTCTGYLRAGYGGGVMSDEACRSVSDRINAGYFGLADAVEAIAPLLGLFASGLYLVADFDLMPVKRMSSTIKPSFFWDLPRYAEEIKYCVFDQPRDAPAYLYPTQRTADLDPAQIEAYQARLDEDMQYPRAVAFYLNGSVALLLDGHHKAVAAAAAGRMVKCLVIFQVQEADALKKALAENRRLYLRHGKNVRVHGSLKILDGLEQTLATTQRLEIMEQHEVAIIPFPEEPWGTLPQAYCAHSDKYPTADDLYNATLIPPECIQSSYRHMREVLIRHNLAEFSLACAALKCLRTYARMFPGDTALNDKQRDWLFAEETDALARGW